MLDGPASSTLPEKGCRCLGTCRRRDTLRGALIGKERRSNGLGRPWRGPCLYRTIEQAGADATRRPFGQAPDMATPERTILPDEDRRPVPAVAGNGRRARRLRRLLPLALLGALVGGLAMLVRAPAPAPAGTPPGVHVPPSTPAADLAPAPARPPPTALYRWRDRQGRVYLVSEPPPAGVTPEVIPLSTPPDVGPTGPGIPAAPGSSPAADLAARPIAVYTPEGLRDLARRLATTRRQLEDRDRVLDGLQQELRP